MQQSKEFRNYAANCSEMANFSNDIESRKIWMGMAERWTRCAERADHEERAANEKEDRRRPRSSVIAKLERRVAELSRGEV